MIKTENDCLVYQDNNKRFTVNDNFDEIFN